MSSAAQRSNRTRRVVSNIKNARKIEDRRDLLVAAAIKVFLNKGFHAATVREIGSAAGLTREPSTTMSDRRTISCFWSATRS